MLHFLFDQLFFRLYHRPVPAWVRRPDPFLPRLRPSYRWWVHW